MEDEQYDSYAESSLSSHYSRVAQQVSRAGFSDQRMDRDSEVERDFDEMQRIREQRVGDLIARRHVLEDEMRRVNAQVRAEEDMASRVRGRGADDLTRFQEGIGVRFGGCRGMTLSQLQSLEDRIATRVEMKVAAFFDRIAASFEAEMAMAFQGLRTMGVSSGERGGYALVPSATRSAQLLIHDKKEGKKIVMLAKPEEEGRKGRFRSAEVANEIPDEDWFCVFCDVGFTSKESYEEHGRNVIHDTVETGSCSPKKRKAVDNDEEALKKNPKSAKVGGEDVVGGSKTGQTAQTAAAEPVDDACQSVDEHKDSSQSKEENGNGNFWCTSCCARLNSRSVMETHVKGKKHRKLAATVSHGDA